MEQLTREKAGILRKFSTLCKKLILKWAQEEFDFFAKHKKQVAHLEVAPVVGSREVTVLEVATVVM